MATEGMKIFTPDCVPAVPDIPSGPPRAPKPAPAPRRDIPMDPAIVAFFRAIAIVGAILIAVVMLFALAPKYNSGEWKTDYAPGATVQQLEHLNCHLYWCSAAICATLIACTWLILARLKSIAPRAIAMQSPAPAPPPDL